LNHRLRGLLQSGVVQFRIQFCLALARLVSDSRLPLESMDHLDHFIHLLMLQTLKTHNLVSESSRACKITSAIMDWKSALAGSKTLELHARIALVFQVFCLIALTACSTRSQTN